MKWKNFYFEKPATKSEFFLIDDRKIEERRYTTVFYGAFHDEFDIYHISPCYLEDGKLWVDYDGTGYIEDITAPLEAWISEEELLRDLSMNMEGLFHE